MTRRWITWTVALAPMVLLTFAVPGLAQSQTGVAGMLAAPHYGSGASAGLLSAGHFNTPEADGRPGVKFFAYGVEAFRKGDYQHAIDMYKVAASWAYKPAEYNLGVMYFRGQGVPVDRPRGAAWMILAAERGDPDFARVRDQMVTLLSKAEFERTDALWGTLRQTYSDAVAMQRAKAQWARARNNRTGSRVGGTVGELRVGTTAPHGGAKTMFSTPNKNVPFHQHGWMNVLGGGSIDSSLVYRQFQQSDNPYDSVFLKNPQGTVTVEPLQNVEHGAAPSEPASGSTSGGGRRGR